MLKVYLFRCRITVTSNGQPTRSFIVNILIKHPRCTQSVRARASFQRVESRLFYVTVSEKGGREEEGGLEMCDETEGGRDRVGWGGGGGEK